MALNNDNNNECCKCTTPEYELILNEQGPQGRQGEKGEAGFTPIISVKDNTDSNYTLNILTQDGQITTPNLKANLPAGGATGQVLTKNSGEQDDCSWQNLPNATEEVEGIARLATETDFTTTEDSAVSETSIVTPALFNNELTKQVQNFIVAGDNITTSVDDDGKVTINADAEAYSLPQANATTLGGIKANPKTDEDTQPVNIDTTTGMLYTKSGGTGLVPATDDSLGGIIVGDGLKVDSEGLTSLDLDVDTPLQLQGSIPSNPYILTPEPGSNISFDDLDVIAFNPANGHNLLQEVNNINFTNPVAGNDYTLSIKNRTSGVLDWKNNIVEIPLGQAVNGALICSVGLNREYELGTNHNKTLGLIWANKDDNGNITPLYYVSTAVPNTGDSIGHQRSCIYAFIDNGTEGDTSTTNYQVHCLHNYTSQYSAANGGALMWINQCRYDEGANTYNFYVSGNIPCWGTSIFPDVDIRNPETWTKWQFSDIQSINWFELLFDITPTNEDKFVNCAFYVTVEGDETTWVNSKYPLLAKFTGNIARGDGVNFVEAINQIDQHYIEVTPSSGKPVLSLNVDGTTITTNTAGQLQVTSNVTTQGNTFNGASQLVQLDASGKLPAIDGSQLTNINTNAIIMTDGNFNNYYTPGIYFWGRIGNSSNNPNEDREGYLQVFHSTEIAANHGLVQIYITCDSDRSETIQPQMYIRYAAYEYSGWTWKDWHEITNQGGTYTLPVATTSTLGGVKPDGTTITVTEDGTISSVGGGSTPTNMVTTNSFQTISSPKIFNPDSTSGIKIGTSESDGSTTGPWILVNDEHNSVVLTPNTIAQTGPTGGTSESGSPLYIKNEHLADTMLENQVGLNLQVKRHSDTNPAGFQVKVDGTFETLRDGEEYTVIDTGNLSDNIVAGTNITTSVGTDGKVTINSTGGTVPDNVVTTDTDQTITGDKTFNSIITASVLRTDSIRSEDDKLSLINLENSGTRLVIGPQNASALSQLFINGAEVRVSGGKITANFNDVIIQKSSNTITIGDAGDIVQNGSNKKFYTEADNQTICNLSFPSLTKPVVELQLPSASGQELTGVPDEAGIIYIAVTATSQDQSNIKINICDSSLNFRYSVNHGPMYIQGSEYSTIIPKPEGARVTCDFSNIQVNYFRFIPADY